MEIALTNHARFKLKVLEEHGYSFTEDEISEEMKSKGRALRVYTATDKVAEVKAKLKMAL